jgi:hypothetical protein
VYKTFVLEEQTEPLEVEYFWNKQRLYFKCYSIIEMSEVPYQALDKERSSDNYTYYDPSEKPQQGKGRKRKISKKRKRISTRRKSRRKRKTSKKRKRTSTRRKRRRKRRTSKKRKRTSTRRKRRRKRKTRKKRKR